MTPPWRAVGTGLRLTQIGARLIGCGTAVCFALPCCCGVTLFRGFDAAPFPAWVIVAVWYTALCTAILGRVVCAAGRWVCLATPPDATAARARIRLVVVHETCGLLTAVTTCGLAISRLPIPPALGLAGWAISVVATVSARVCFYLFLRAVAERVADDSNADVATRLFRVAIVVVVAGSVGAVLLAFGFNTPAENDTRLFLQSMSCVGTLLLAVAFSFGLYLLLGHFMLVAGLRRRLAEYTPPPADDDPDRAYRERYSANPDPDG